MERTHAEIARGQVKGQKTAMTEATSEAILREGENCWRIAPAERVAFLVDGEAFFAAFAAAVERAQQ
jgi:phosphatidylserine/phosphatidylglycerophosphate/cardiolipin synthase-like enzyme